MSVVEKNGRKIIVVDPQLVKLLSEYLQEDENGQLFWRTDPKTQFPLKGRAQHP